MFDIVIPSIYTLLQLLVYMTFGFCLAKFLRWPRIFFKYLSLFIINFALPLYFFTSISKTTRENIIQGALFPPFALLLVGGSFIIAYFLYWIFGIKGNEKRATIGLATFGNSGYVPLGLIEVFPATLPFLTQKFDPKISTLFIGTYLLVNSPLLWSIGNFLIAGSKERFPKPKEFFSPPLWGIVSGLVFAGLGAQAIIADKHLPFYFIFTAFEKIGSTTVPLIMITLGSMIGELKVEKQNWNEYTKNTLLILLVRFIITPALYWLLFFTVIKEMHLTPLQNWIIFLEMHTPAATNFSVMASKAGKSENFVSFALLMSYVGFLVLLPIYLLLFIMYALNY